MNSRRLCTRDLVRLVGGVRFGSSKWRHVESPAPILVTEYETKARPNTPTMIINVRNESRKVAVSPGMVEKTEQFDSNTVAGSIRYITGGLYELLESPVADSDYQKMYFVKNEGFIQFREHFRHLMKPKSPGSPRQTFVLKGSRQCGRTLSCYAMLIKSVTAGELVIPGLHLAKWFQDTPQTTLINTPHGELDFPEINAQFLKFFVACNTFGDNSAALNELTLLDDERWTSQSYSFKGESLLNVAKIGITTPPVACHVIRTILSTINASKTPCNVILDNANLLSDIHSSMECELRNVRLRDWWNQSPIISDNVTLLRSLKDFVKEHSSGTVVMTIDPRNDITDKVIDATTADPESVDVITIPNTSTEEEYLNYLKLLRDMQFLSRDLTKAQVSELTYLTGKSYPDTFKYSVMM